MTQYGEYFHTLVNNLRPNKADGEGKRGMCFHEPSYYINIFGRIISSTIDRIDLIQLNLAELYVT